MPALSRSNSARPPPSKAPGAFDPESSVPVSEQLASFQDLGIDDTFADEASKQPRDSNAFQRPSARSDHNSDASSNPGEVQEFAASLLKQAGNAPMNFLANMIKAEIAQCQAPSQVKAKKSRALATPEKFSGSRKDLDSFVFDCQQVLKVNHDHFMSVDAQIGWITSLLTGSAAKTIRAYADRNGDLHFQSPQELFNALRLNFGDPDEEGAARTKILSLRQANRDFSVYVSEFQLYAHRSNYPESVLKDHLLRGLSTEMHQALIAVPYKPMTYTELVSALQLIDSRRRRYPEANRNTESSRKTSKKASSSTAASQLAASTSTSSTTPFSSSANKPRRGKISDEERARRIRKKACFYCGRGDHDKSNCPELQKKEALKAAKAAGNVSTLTQTPISDPATDVSGEEGAPQ